MPGPPEAYVQLPFTTTPSGLEDDAVAFLESKWSNWSPNDADMEVIQIEAVAPMATNAAQIASNMPPAALIAFGTKLLGVPYGNGTPATAVAKFTISFFGSGSEIPAGTVIDIEGIAFQTVSAIVVPTFEESEGSIEVTGEVRASDVGEAANDLPGVSWQSVTLPVFVVDMVLEAPTGGGVNQEDDSEYLNKISRELQRRAKSTITLIDFEIVALEEQGVGAATAAGLPTKPRTIRVYLKSPEGTVVGKEIKEAIEAEYVKTRMVNAQVSILDPTYSKITPTWRAMALPGVDTANLEAMGNAALEAALSPGPWGTPTSAQPGLSWVNQPIVHVNKLIGILSSVAGLDYVESLTLEASDIAQLAKGLAEKTKVKELNVCSLASTSLGTLSALLSTGGAITSLPTNPLTFAIPNGVTIRLNDGAGHTQEWKTTAEAPIGATAIVVTSQVPGFAYPANTTHIEGPSVALANTVAVGEKVTLTSGAHSHTFTITEIKVGGIWKVTEEEVLNTFPIGSTISGTVVGDLTMPGEAPLPEAGEPVGTVDSPALT